MNPFRRNIINIYRLPPDLAIDSDRWERIDFDNLVPYASGIAADIQQKRTTGRIPAGLPGDVYTGEIWEIFFNLGQNTVLKRDIILDVTTPLVVPTNQRRCFQVTSPYWTVFQYQCLCEELQT